MTRADLKDLADAIRLLTERVDAMGAQLADSRPQAAEPNTRVAGELLAQADLNNQLGRNPRKHDKPDGQTA